MARASTARNCATEGLRRRFAGACAETRVDPNGNGRTVMNASGAISVGSTALTRSGKPIGHFAQGFVCSLAGPPRACRAHMDHPVTPIQSPNDAPNGRLGRLRSISARRPSSTKSAPAASRSVRRASQRRLARARRASANDSVRFSRSRFCNHIETPSSRARAMACLVSAERSDAALFQPRSP